MSGIHSAIIPNAAGYDSMITLIFTIGQGSTETIIETACDSYTWALTGQNYTSTDLYSVTLTNAAGCDSILNLNLTINSANTGMSLIGDVTIQAKQVQRATNG